MNKQMGLVKKEPEKKKREVYIESIKSPFQFLPLVTWNTPKILLINSPFSLYASACWTWFPWHATKNVDASHVFGQGPLLLIIFSFFLDDYHLGPE